MSGSSRPTDMTALVRGYSPTQRTAKGASLRNATKSNYALIFDTETTTDGAQALRFGFYEFWKKSKLVEAGIFYDPDRLTAEEIAIVTDYAAARKMRLLARREFVDDVFYDQAYRFGATIIGFNLPFDLSRIAIACGSARRKMRGGFTFQLSDNKYLARIQVRHLNARAALMQFAAPPRQRTPRGQRKRGLPVPPRRGSFIDVKTLAAALLSRPFSLKALADHLETDHRKLHTEDHGYVLTEEYLDYAAMDVRVTKECLDRLLVLLETHELHATPASQVLSEASLGKGYLRAMGVRSFLDLQPDFPPKILGHIMGAYYGGRTEVRWRRVLKRVLYCDFLSMYPTVFSLMGIWPFVIAKGLDRRDTTAETQAMIDRVTLNDLQHNTFWPKLHTLVRLRPDQDILPIRARFNEMSPTIGLNVVSSDILLWYTLADVLASKIQTGRTPRIDEAITFMPRKPQVDLRPVQVCGDPHIDPYAADFFKTVIDLRQGIKEKMKRATAAEKTRLDTEQLALKILANSTSYGIFVEMNVNDHDDPQELFCYGSDDRPFATQSKKTEEPGTFFHPIIATLITGAARLMLSLAECLARRQGLDWAFCDTDSIAFVKPDTMSEEEFAQRTDEIIDWFAALNPYEKTGSILKVEDVNLAVDKDGVREPLYCYAISSKRYALFNLAADGTPIIRKASAHGLGHLRPPYSAEDAPTSIPAPSVPLEEIGVERWHYDLWFTIVTAALAGEFNEVLLYYHTTLRLPACSRYAATKPAILRWFKHFNEGKVYADQVKPFGFLTSLSARHEAVVAAGRHKPKPIAPFTTNPAEAAVLAFDRHAGSPIPHDDLRTYAQALAPYHLSAEAKFLNGDHFDVGRTECRHLRIATVQHIGKEADRWEENMHFGAEDDGVIDYPALDGSADKRLRAMYGDLGERETALRLGVSRMALRKAIERGVTAMTPRITRKIVGRS